MIFQKRSDPLIPDIIKTKLTNLLSRHLEDSYYEPLANYILLLHQRRSWITRTNDQDQLKEFIEKVNENHSWLPSKNLPVLKIIALAKLKNLKKQKRIPEKFISIS